MVPDLRAAVHHHPPAHVTAHVTDHGGKVSKTQPFPPYNHSRPAISHSLIFPVGREWSQTFAPRFITTRPHTSPTTSPHTAGRSRKLNHSRPTIIHALQSHIFQPCNSANRRLTFFQAAQHTNRVNRRVGFICWIVCRKIGRDSRAGGCNSVSSHGWVMLDCRL